MEAVGLCWAMAAIHDQPSNSFLRKKVKNKATQKQVNMQKKRSLLCFCIFLLEEETAKIKRSKCENKAEQK